MGKGLRTLAIWLAFVGVLVASAVFISLGGRWTVFGVAGFGLLAALLVGLTLYAYFRNKKGKPTPA